ncbi:hypothetical protein HDG42_007917, partial [Paraburkholderia sp. JPY171]|nr:hypothetical protein [Paraburkholderia atlantica]
MYRAKAGIVVCQCASVPSFKFVELFVAYCLMDGTY